MKSEKIIAGTILWILSGLIYIYTTYKAYRFFYEYSHLRNMWLILGVVAIMLCWLAAIWFMFYEYNYFMALREKKKRSIEEVEKNNKQEKIIIEEEEITPRKKEKKNIVIEESTQRKKDKKIQKRYQEVMLEYKKTLPAREYKKFEEDTKYDILLYDALMISRDKEWTLLSKIEQEKGELYATALKKILE